MQNNVYDVPRVELPDLSEEERAQIEAVQEEMDWYVRTKRNFLTLLIANPQVYLRKPKPRRKPTKHQRHMASVKARSAYVRSQA